MAPFFNWGARTREGTAPAAVPASRIVETLSASRALPKLIGALSGEQSPVLLDLGPVVGANVAFFGEHLSCKMLIEDLREEIDAAAGRGTNEGLAEALVARISGAVVEPVHGVLCWDIFDCLERTTARAVAARLSTVLRPRGVLHGFFGTTSGVLSVRTKFIVQSHTSLKCRHEPAVRLPRYPLQTGEIARLFGGLSTLESVLLQNRTREILLRKS